MYCLSTVFLYQYIIWSFNQPKSLSRIAEHTLYFLSYSGRNMLLDTFEHMVFPSKDFQNSLMDKYQRINVVKDPRNRKKDIPKHIHPYQRQCTYHRNIYLDRL